ncbi:protein kinase [Legionella israelensis]|uniref:protein kinase domain-containing protein n=1 Tax=Legionella israelensis TaxID=454 RepID=UPI00117CB114|nr:protein kinase [Legionella israelensis]QDP72847.1 protein kinase [Legionella israelensis]
MGHSQELSAETYKLTTLEVETSHSNYNVQFDNNKDELDNQTFLNQPTTFIPASHEQLDTLQLTRLLARYPIMDLTVLNHMAQDDNCPVRESADYLLQNSSNLESIIFILDFDGKLTKGKNYQAQHSLILLQNQDKKFACLIGKTIGEGSRGIVKEGYDLTTGKKIAIKIDREKDYGHKRALELFHTEKGGLLFFKRFQGECIRENRRKVYLAEDFLDGQNAEQYLHQLDGEAKLSPLETYLKTFQLMCNMMCAVKKMHENYGVHRDLKLNNFMRLKNGDYEIIDLDSFTYGSLEYNVPQLDYLYSNIKNIAPETIEEIKRNGKYVFTQASDIYSMGKTLERASKISILALNRFDEPDLKENLKNQTLEPVLSCIQQMKNDAPSERPSAAQACEQLLSALTKAKSFIHDRALQNDFSDYSATPLI